MWLFNVLRYKGFTNIQITLPLALLIIKKVSNFILQALKPLTC